MLFYQRKGERKLERGVLTKELEKMVELDNIRHLKELEVGYNKIDVNKLLAQLAAGQQKTYFGPEPKSYFDNEEPPGIF